MKSFDKIIKIEIAANQIAEMLLANMNPEFKHAELVVESIIGSATEQGLNMLYNSINGFSPEIDFKVGDVVNPKGLQYYNYTSDSGKGNYVSVESATVVEIDLYSKDKLKVTYKSLKRDGSEHNSEEWVSHLKCSKIALGSIDLRKEKIDLSAALQDLVI